MQPVLITGFHRSGTSWVARALHEAGFHLGDDLLDAEPGNPYGHFEDIDVIALHDAALDAQGLSWKSTEPLTRPVSDETTDGLRQVIESRKRLGSSWAIKDPRLCLLLPEWLEALPDSRVLVVFRQPAEVVSSLHRRHAQRWVNTRHIDPSDLAFWEHPDLGVALWVHYNEQLLAALEPVDQSDIHVVDWNDPTTTTDLMSTIEHKWNLETASKGPPRDPRLGLPTPEGLEVRDPRLLDRANEVWDRLHDLARRTNTS